MDQFFNLYFKLTEDNWKMNETCLLGESTSICPSVGATGVLTTSTG